MSRESTTPQPRQWFKARRFGWGWTPVTVEGWLVTGGYVVLILAGWLVIAPHQGGQQPALFVGYVVVLTALLLAICYKTGEKPRWRWGK